MLEILSLSLFPYFLTYSFINLFEIKSYYIALADLALTLLPTSAKKGSGILLPLHLKCWKYGHVPPSQGFITFLLKSPVFGSVRVFVVVVYLFWLGEGLGLNIHVLLLLL